MIEIKKTIKFCGATVKGIQSNIGWQEQSSSLMVDLVEDDNETFSRPEPGTPVSFELEKFKFDGIVQRWGKSIGTSGNLFNINISSPSEILENVQLILDVYRGVNLICPNLFNVFGYLEGADLASFGGSGRNESGIAWYKIKSAIEGIQAGGTQFSPGIKYKGHTYYVDFGGMPAVPDFYRIGGDFITLMQAIRTVFEDAGYDFVVLLDKKGGNGPHRIFFKTKSRLKQEPLGQISVFIEDKDNIISAEEGAELRNDITSGVILGGSIEEAVPMQDGGDGNTIWPFWGFKQTPFLIPFGTEGNQPIVESTGFHNNHIANLDATAIADVIGTNFYPCSVLEMRFALVDFDSWSMFIVRKRPELAAMMGFSSFASIFNDGEIDDNPQSMFANTVQSIALFSQKIMDSVAMKQLDQVYNFVKSQAETYFGKQFIVRIPFLLKYYFEEETSKLNYNMAVNQDGYWPDYIGGWASGPLGLSYENFNRFMTSEGKFTPFVRYGGENMAYADMSTKSLDNVIIQGYEVFSRCSVDSNIIFTPAPAALITVDEPMWATPPDCIGGIREIAEVLGIYPNQLLRILKNNNGEFPMKLHPWPIVPNGANICLKSYENTYGPWYKIGAPGKVKIEQNQGLVPWNYGGFEIMNQAAEAQLADIGTTVQMEESGQVSVAGAPEISIGDQLGGSGPVISSIDISIGDNGIQTTYRMRSQTPVYGTFSKQNADRLRRLGVAAQDMRRNMRSLMDRMKYSARIGSNASWGYMQNTSRAVKQANANRVIHASLSISDNGFSTAQIATQDFPGALGASNAHDNKEYQHTASMGLEGLVRPFSTNSSAEDISSYEEPISPAVEDPVSYHIVNQNKLNPLKSGSDIKWIAHGESFNGFYNNGTVSDSDIRAIALRGPVLISGWGYDLNGKPVPNSEQGSDKLLHEMTNNFVSDYLKRSTLWKTGSVDLRWDKWRKVWTSPFFIPGKYLGKDDEGKHKIKIEGYEDIITGVDVDFFSSKAPRANTNVGVLYYPLLAKWYVIVSKC